MRTIADIIADHLGRSKSRGEVHIRRMGSGMYERICKRSNR